MLAAKQRQKAIATKKIELFGDDMDYVREKSFVPLVPPKNRAGKLSNTNSKQKLSTIQSEHDLSKSKSGLHHPFAQANN